jgi:hypothetical protein
MGNDDTRRVDPAAGRQKPLQQGGQHLYILLLVSLILSAILETWLKIVDGLPKHEDTYASVRALGAAKANQQKGIGDGKVYSPVRLLNDCPELNSGKEGTGIEKAKVWLRMAL